MKDLTETITLWKAIYSYQVVCVLQPRQTTKQRQTPTERKVTLELWHTRGKVVLHMQREERAVDNLAALCQLAETLRMNEVRKLDSVIRDVYRTWYPSPAATPPPQPQAVEEIPAHYRALHVHPSAPLYVIEAAYKALVKVNHPDLGGSTEVMQTINASMDKIRQERS